MSIRRCLFACMLLASAAAVPAIAVPFAFVEEVVFINAADQKFSGELAAGASQEFSGSFRDDHKAVFEVKFKHSYPEANPCPSFSLQLLDIQKNVLTTSTSFEREKECYARAAVEVKYSVNYRTLYGKLTNGQTANAVKFELKISSFKPKPEEK